MSCDELEKKDGGGRIGRRRSLGRGPAIWLQAPKCRCVQKKNGGGARDLLGQSVEARRRTGEQPLRQALQGNEAAGLGAL